jgi:DNA-directed RNA polymerase subunit RPC12/RpoP
MLKMADVTGGSEVKGEIITARFTGQTKCLECGRDLDAHSRPEELDCSIKQQAKIAEMQCSICTRKFGEHSKGELIACAHEQRDSKR